MEQATKVPLADRSCLDPLADALQWDWRSLQRCAIVSSAWRAAMSPVMETLEARLAKQLEELQKRCAERAATEQERLHAKPHVLCSIAKVEIAEGMHFKCPHPVIIRTMSLALYILTEHERLAAGWLPAPGLPDRPGGPDYIFWNSVKNAWNKEQLDELWRQDGGAPKSVAKMRELSIASVPLEKLEQLYQRREEPYMLPEKAYAQSRLAGKLAEWMQALVAEWSVVRARHHPDAPALLTLKHELAWAAQRRAHQQRANEQRAADGAARAREEEERLRLSEDHRQPADDAHAHSRDLVVEAQARLCGAAAGITSFTS